MNKNIFSVQFRKTLSMLAVMGLLLSGNLTSASADEVLDCPLRDVAYSTDLPLMEILIKPEAREIVNRHMNGMLDKMPGHFMSEKAPSLSAIMSVKNIGAMTRSSDEVMQKIDKELRQLGITAADKVARCARYDNEVPELDVVNDRVNILVFHKINGFDHGPSVTAATLAIQTLAEQLGWSVSVTDKAGVFNPKSLAQFDAVVWNNNSGDVLTLTQRKEFEDYINKGGSYLGLHGAGGDSLYLWTWYADELLGARFIGHPNDPQFQMANVGIEKSHSGIADSLIPGWKMKDEWYSFGESPRKHGADVIATLDESTYIPEARGRDLRMGEDHPIVWTRCVGKGRSFYSAIGHRPEVYYIPENLLLLTDALKWVAGKDKGSCQAS